VVPQPVFRTLTSPLFCIPSVPYLEQISSILSYCMLSHMPSSSKTSYRYFFENYPSLLHGCEKTTSSYNLYMQQIGRFHPFIGYKGP
jgi:hypothetical protein